MALAPTHPEVLETPATLPAGPAPRRWRAASDEFLVRAAARGNDGAIAAIHDRYRGPLERYCRTIVLHHEDAEDAAQAALAAALRALVDGRARPHALRAWLYRIAHREALAVLRRRPPTAGGDDALLELLPTTRRDRVDTRADLQELLDELRALPERSRSALVLHELAGLSFDEIGETLEISSGAARQAAYEARTKLRAGRAELAALFPAGPAIALAGGTAAGGAGLVGSLFAGGAAKCAAVCATIGVVGAGSFTVVHPPTPRSGDRPAAAEPRERAAKPRTTTPSAAPVTTRPAAPVITPTERRAASRAKAREERRAAARSRARERARREARERRETAATPVAPVAAVPEPDVTSVDVEESPTGGAVDRGTAPADVAAAPAPQAKPSTPSSASSVGTGEITGAATQDVISITVE